MLDGLAAGENVHSLKRARAGRKLVFAREQGRSSAGKGRAQLEGPRVSNHSFLRQQRGDLGNTAMGWDDDGLRLGQRAGLGDVPINPISRSPDYRQKQKDGKDGPSKEAEKASHPSATGHSQVQGGAAKIKEALVPPKPKELDST